MDMSRPASRTLRSQTRSPARSASFSRLLHCHAAGAHPGGAAGGAHKAACAGEMPTVGESWV